MKAAKGSKVDVRSSVQTGGPKPTFRCGLYRLFGKSDLGSIARAANAHQKPHRTAVCVEVEALEVICRDKRGDASDVSVRAARMARPRATPTLSPPARRGTLPSDFAAARGAHGRRAG